MNALKMSDIYELTTLPKGKTFVGSRMAYTIKCIKNGDEQYRARFVAQGYSQTHEIDYNETFFPTARLSSVRTLIQLTIQHNLSLHQMDVKTS